MYYFLLVVFVFIAFLLIVVVLLQRSRGDVGTAFGGMGQGVFGPGGVDTILTKITYWLGFLFMFIAILLALTHPSKRGSLLKDEGARAPQKTQQSIPERQGAPSGTPPESKGR
ncbi:preprotein translocase subunit SecG [Hydrogenobacter thermophilus]|uniref:Protein-export membrane protein SecG n=1 Tax=Hydrogenobacter thermophilus (strain DSM 6534 / IAM 12695 / TK-6) TaxID=608538 RepID=D3DGY3_HYDTT|nr:preprotein translocase subunit SecG [Hydrogenobacter thermophilus]BAI69085.1 protein export membrane protein [Hydrogenobacter thermophilus TK-6]